MRTEYFAAANSGDGFVSYYDAIFGREEIERRYLIKGGPGTGKSSLIRACAVRAEGQGTSVEYYRCSSDPDSLDGIIIGGKIAVFDATAPHAAEAVLPGVRDETVDLGQFWNSARLRENRQEIVSLNREKKNCYKRAYDFLAAAKAVERGISNLTEPLIMGEKLDRAVTRLMRCAGEGNRFSILPGLVDSIGMKGRLRLSTYERAARVLICVSDYYGSAHLFFRRVIEAARKRSLSVRVSYGVVDPTKPNAVLLTDSGVCFSLCDTDPPSAVSTVNMKRFLMTDRLAAVRGACREERRVRDRLLMMAEEALSYAGIAHLGLERIYGSSMDFEALGAFTSSFSEHLL